MTKLIGNIKIIHKMMKGLSIIIIVCHSVRVTTSCLMLKYYLNTYMFYSYLLIHNSKEPKRNFYVYLPYILFRPFLPMHFWMSEQYPLNNKSICVCICV